MMAIEIFAVAVGLLSLAALVLVSIRGPRDRGGRLRGRDGPIVPLGHDDGGK
jgi:hypothetical protein